MNIKIKNILKAQLDLVKPPKEDAEKINRISQEFSNKLKENLKKKKIKAEVFLGVI